MDGQITVELLKSCDWSPHKLTEVNFSKLTDSNHIFRIDLVSIHYHLSEISCQIIEGKNDHRLTWGQPTKLAWLGRLIGDINIYIETDWYILEFGDFKRMLQDAKNAKKSKMMNIGASMIISDESDDGLNAKISEHGA